MHYPYRISTISFQQTFFYLRLSNITLNQGLILKPLNS